VELKIITRQSIGGKKQPKIDTTGLDWKVFSNIKILGGKGKLGTVFLS
jgi:hypothetical protein